ncbi:hypothetical protein MBLNU457_4628t1 [Dothideomycetes sp. NU457]
MAPTPTLLPLGQGPRVVVYHQTHHRNDRPVSVLALITNQTGVTHVIIAAIHLNDGARLTLNDDPPDAAKFQTLWSEVAWLRASGIKVLGMLGGAAKGSFTKLDGSQDQFEEYYAPLSTLIRTQHLDGLDLDVEEPMSLQGIIRLIDRLRTDFGPSFLITLAPVATALVPGQKHLSGFSYHALEAARGREIAWYNAQFYCGWGDASTVSHYAYIVGVCGWDTERVVLGLVTNPGNGAGYVAQANFDNVVREIRNRFPRFGGVMGWEYFNSLPGGEERPWEWAGAMARVVRCVLPSPVVVGGGGALQAPIVPQHSFPADSVQTLKDLGFSQQAAVAALNMTGGNVEYAAGLLFQD